jgi:hypothetical protein
MTKIQFWCIVALANFSALRKIRPVKSQEIYTFLKRGMIFMEFNSKKKNAKPTKEKTHAI